MLCNVNDNQFYIQLTNWGLLVARYSITYSIGSQAPVKVSSDNILIGGVRRLFFPKNTDELMIFAEELYLPGLWTPLFKRDLTSSEARKNRCFSCYGLSITPIVKEFQCTDSLDLIQKQSLELQNDFLLNYYYKNALYLQLLNNNCNTITNPNNFQ